MAKYQDYIETDNIEDEITDASQQSAERVSQIPERFRNKTAEEIAQSYVELEKLNSRQAQDLGAMRKQVDELVREFQESKETQEAAEEEPPLSIDDLYSDPTTAIERVVKKVVEPTLKQTEEFRKQQEINARLAELDQQYSDWRSVVATEEFNEWANATPYRARMVAAANNYDFDAASDLFAQYYDLRSSASTQAKEATRRQQLRDATLETGGAAYSEPPTTYSRTDLIHKRILAKRGDREADMWLRTHKDAIAQAYEEGRVKD